MKIPSPFIPLRISTSGLEHKTEVIGRSYTFGADGMLSSITAEGKELLAAPMRLVLKEDGAYANFDENYPENESESFIQSRSDEKAVICGCKQSDRFIIDFCNTIEYDGNIDINLKLMPRGLTVAQVFGVGQIKPLQFILDNLWLEIPLKKEAFTLYHMHTNGSMYFSDGTVKEQDTMSMSGLLPEKDFSLSFKPLLWLGNEEYGLGWYAENNRNWQNESEEKAIEILHTDEQVVLRIRLLDSHPYQWDGNPEKGYTLFDPISFHFGFQATPVKPFPKNPYFQNTLHIDCGKKIKGNYMDFFASENRFDRLKEKGVTTLILHEKWNKSQNWFELSEYTAKQLTYIVDECHKRGIKVLPYFGYEISAMAPVWSELSEKCIAKPEANKFGGGWWRVPFQRDYIACYKSDYAEYFVKGITKLMDDFNIDGVYLDSITNPHYCCNTEHGCGWYNKDGVLCGSYPIKSIRKTLKNLYTEVHKRGGQLNVHSHGVVNFAALPFIDQSWYGENIQSKFMQGCLDDVDLDYFRAEYIGRNMGVPVEFIAYENRPLWNFENALSCSILHGILPRPNDINYPLDLMSGVWKIIDNFPVSISEWMPYWENNATATSDKVKISYYKYKTLAGEDQLLAFVVNISSNPLENVTVAFEEQVTKATDLVQQSECSFTFNMNPYDYKILFIR